MHEALTGPYEFPAVLAVLGLLTVLLASTRGRSAAKERTRRLLRLGYGGAGLLALSLGLWLGGQHAMAFWAVSWSAEDAAIVLDRPLPLGDVRLQAEEIEYVAEVSAPERTLSGVSRVSRFEVKLTSGDRYMSVPMRDEGQLDPWRRSLAAADGGRLQKFRIR